MDRSRLSGLLPYTLLAGVFAVVLTLRPVIPIDETRYLTVAWEMWLRQNFLVPTVNFAPYFQKPPLLFWLIDLAWSIFGVGRASALVPIFAISAAVIYLTSRLAQALLPADTTIAERVAWLLAGNLVFMLYSSLVLFDLLLTAGVLSSLLASLAYFRTGALRYTAVAGLLAGIGVLAKGPVIFVHLAWPLALYPIVYGIGRRLALRHPLRAFLAFLVCAAMPVALWLASLTMVSSWEVLYRLVWLQSVGRVGGQLEDAHVRPLYFYLPLLPLFLEPWFGLPGFWRGIRAALSRSDRVATDRVTHFAALWALGVTITFSLIAGKQPHYLVPILPPVTITLACLLKDTAVQRLWQTALISLALFSAGHLIARYTLFRSNDLSDVAQLMQRLGGDWAVTSKYQGELNFLARRDKPLTVIEGRDAASWLSQSASRYLVDLNGKAGNSGKIILEQPYRRRHLRVFH